MQYQRAGVAEFATLLKQAKSRMPADATVIVTLNGDFLWRSEVDRRDKGYVAQPAHRSGGHLNN